MNSTIKRALISVSDKNGLVGLGQFLSENGVEILSTGGSAKCLRGSNIPVVDVTELTGVPEMMDGRVKTLHPIIHGGILANRNSRNHEKSMSDHGIKPIDLLIVNLYPFVKTVESGGNIDECVENIDIGGPALIRAAAKNYAFVTVIIDPHDYEKLKEEMRLFNGATSEKFRIKNAAKAYANTAAYDASIFNWFHESISGSMPQDLIFCGSLKHALRYGENPHQEGYFYTNDEKRPGVASADQLQGKQLSYNNLNDTDAAFELVSEYQDVPACVIVKHANPCGVALGQDLLAAYERALHCDLESAFGGILAFNQIVNGSTALKIVENFFEVVIAPGFDKRALDILKAKDNLRLLSTGALPLSSQTGKSIKSLSGGFLVQESDNKIVDSLIQVTKRKPSKREMTDLKFAFIVAKHTKSNAIVYAKNEATVGIGAGQMSRVNASRIAAWKAFDAAKKAGENDSWAVGSVVASDAFFPFPDGLIAAAEAGVTAIIQPGGSVRDDQVIAAADESNLAMVFTGMRHFRH